MASNGNGGSSFAWFLVGTITGATVALLYAPRSGRDTRKYIGKQTERQGRALTQSGKELVERSKDLYDKGRAIADEAADLFERGRKLVQG
jgi:gas vesicle protein